MQTMNEKIEIINKIQATSDFEHKSYPMLSVFTWNTVSISMVFARKFWMFIDYLTSYDFAILSENFSPVLSNHRRLL